MQRSPIEWTCWTANPLKYRDAGGNVVHACIHKSTGCLHCYAETLAPRWGRAGKKFTVENMNHLTPFLDEKELHHMLTHKPAAGKMCFVGDMRDLFGEWVPFELLDKLFAVFALRSDVTWQVLTKRPERMLRYLTGPTGAKIPELGPGELTRHGVVFCETESFAKFWKKPPYTITWPLPNVWLGVSCENQQYADERIPLLLQTPAAVRFVSYEPALGPVDFCSVNVGGGVMANVLIRYRDHSFGSMLTPDARIDQVIIGGESGPGARPFEIQWARSTVSQCMEAGVACFVKQLGSKPVSNFHLCTIDCECGLHYGFKDRKGADMNEWPEDLRVREFPSESQNPVHHKENP